LALLVASRAWVPDTQNGMRLFRTDALRSVPIPEGGYDAESRHLRALLADGLRISSVEIPTIYDGEPSHFRPVGDTIAVGRALVASPASSDGATDDAGWGAVAGAVREWSPRALAMLAGTIAIGATLPVLQPLDEAAFLAVNHLGDGPAWLYGALDPHTRNYILLFGLAVVGTAVMTRRVRYAVGVGVAVVLAGYLAGVALEFAKVFVDRPRPEEVLGAEAWTSHARDWSHIASYPSGHLIVTTALATVAAAAVPKLRSALLVYVVAVGATRVLFGAHFPLDVVVGTALGYELGVLSVAMVASAGWLPAAMLREPQPILSSALHRRRVSTIH
jgi:membrane-associated phospholipid phosphatase